jgi:hypothetical protein
MLVFSLISFISCSGSTDRVLYKQVQKESKNYTQIINDIYSNEIAVKYPGDMDLSSIFPVTTPDSWIFEAQSPNKSSTMKCGLAMPISKDVQPGYKKVTIDPNVSNNYSDTLGTYIPPDNLRGGTAIIEDRASRLNPDTDNYIVKKFLGPPRWLQTIIFTNPNIKDYPKLIILDLFTRYKVVQSPYFVPDDCTHGIYIFEIAEFRYSKTDYSLTSSINQLKDENPYLQNDPDFVLNQSSINDRVKNIRTQITKINKDFDTALAFIQSIDAKYFKPNSYNSADINGFNKYKKDIEISRGQLTQIDTKIQLIEKWDFTNLQKYRDLVNKE